MSLPEGHLNTLHACLPFFLIFNFRDRVLSGTPTPFGTKSGSDRVFRNNYKSSPLQQDSRLGLSTTFLSNAGGKTSLNDSRITQ
jgi:hypothetical protein